MKSMTIFWVLIALSQISQAGLYEDLAELKKICDDSLLTQQECAARKDKLLGNHSEKKELWYCNYAGEQVEPKHFKATDGLSFSQSASASSIVKEIIDEAGLAPNFIVRPANVPNAMASSYDGSRFIEYNPQFIHDLKTTTQTNWTIYSIMAHEIGHHLQGHTIQAGGSRPDIELEADEYSGFILAKLGANLAESQMAMDLIASEETSSTHPAKNLRLKAIEKGWNKGKASSENITANSTPANPQEASEPNQAQVQNETLVTTFCVIDGTPLLITDSNLILSYELDYMQIGEAQPAVSELCLFDLLTVDGRYCVIETGEIFFDKEDPVGKCEACDEVLCGNL